jgi:hypothetical protein
MKQKNKKKRKLKLKKWQIALICVLAFVFAISVFVLVWYFGDRYKDFDEFTEELEIPALDEGFAPQGMTYYSNYFFISGYMNDGSASRVYVVYRTTSNDKNVYTNRGYATFTIPNNTSDSTSTASTTFTGHAGGIATNGTTVWIASDGYVYVFKYSDLSSLCSSSSTADSTKEISFYTSFNANCNASFAYYYSNTLYIGEFYRAGNYETAQSHHFTDDNGTEYKALYFEFTTSTNTTTYPAGIISAKKGADDKNLGISPNYAVAIPDRIQGMAICNNTIVFSQSYGVSASHLLTYSYSSSRSSYLTDSGKTVAVNENSSGNNASKYDVPVYFLNEQVNDYVIPCMSEGLATYSSKVYVLFESGATKYRPWVRESLKNVYSFTPKKKDA